MTRKPLALFVVGCAMALALAGCGGGGAAAAGTSAAPAAPVIDVAVVPATVTTVQSSLEISGTLAARTRVGVKAKVPGRVARVLVDIGDRVSAGQVVATLERGELDAQVDAVIAAVNVAKAGVESAEATLANAVVEHERARSLFESGALPRQRLDAAQTANRAASAQRDLARASLAQAEASVRRAREVQRDATLHAPVSGFIVERNYDAGAIPGDLPMSSWPICGK